ncbi:heavy metal translocating P-type ATPase [Dysgonomonas macrotermitis]|uniref:P-type Zn(2+) transporter n=1 Tax=Dysgonomonas macrotermitis TaxID=1346286 RepID=A0A1M5FNQ5_9BACT|nr:heavy metal translocating P-type ATPase [Dysgonomonas macrotermitis]SHF92812.1 Cd2+/Zn2+-exporting ATPase [Dysgonomonas macrotermitis]
MSHSHSCSCQSHCETNEHEHDHGNGSSWKVYLPVAASLILLFAGIGFDYFDTPFFYGYIRLFWYIAAYIPVAYPVLKETIEGFMQKEFFTEFSLMFIATLGAFIIGEYPEGVAVMLFYTIGELFQGAAVNKAKGNIKALLDVRPDSAFVYRDGKYTQVPPETVSIGERIQVKAGEKVPLDGKILSERSSFNTSALTGESKPKTIQQGETVLAGMLNLDKVIEIEVEKVYSDSSLAKILDMVQNATSRKAKTELLIRKLAKVYTPIVFFLAVAITVIPFFIVNNYIFSEWLYRGLVFLVISCPCALVISIPLGYFGGIGAASSHGILFKGANYLDLMTKVNTVVMDKTGTLTEGVFKVQRVETISRDSDSFLEIIASLENNSNHPIAKAISAYRGDKILLEVSEVEEIPGHGLKGTVNGQTVLAGNTKLLKKYGISYDPVIDTIVETIVVAAIDNQYAGYITIADQVKEDAEKAVAEMHRLGIRKTVVLSGDKTSITEKLARSLGIDSAYGDLLPEDKVHYLEQLKADKENIIAFVGDGINDAPALALSDIGIAMGGMGSDAAIEVADVVIQTDQPSKIATAINIAKATRQIVFQNIILAIVIKVAVLFLGAFAVASMWEAVFADVGVALLAILNAVRIMKKKF